MLFIANYVGNERRAEKKKTILIERLDSYLWIQKSAVGILEWSKY